MDSKKKIKELRQEIRFLNALLDGDGGESEWDWNAIYEAVKGEEESKVNRYGEKIEVWNRVYPKGMSKWLEKRWNLNQNTSKTVVAKGDKDG